MRTPISHKNSISRTVFEIPYVHCKWKIFSKRTGKKPGNKYSAALHTAVLVYMDGILMSETEINNLEDVLKILKNVGLISKHFKTK